jgi:hypothetical protein
MTTTMSKNGRTQRPNLSQQIDRLDGILDGLAEALNESVADAVKDVVGQAVREAVQATLREVLANQDLFRAALAQHEPQAPPEPVSPTPARRTLKEKLAALRAWALQQARAKAEGAARSVASAWAWCLAGVRRRCSQALASCKALVAGAAGAVKAVGPAARQLWRFRRPCLLALGVGVLSGVAAYLAGPVLAGVACGLGSTLLTLLGMVLLPLWRLLQGAATTT